VIYAIASTALRAATWLPRRLLAIAVRRVVWPEPTPQERYDMGHRQAEDRGAWL